MDDVCRRKDCMKRFRKCLGEHAIINFQKNKMMLITNEQQIS